MTEENENSKDHAVIIAFIMLQSFLFNLAENARNLEIKLHYKIVLHGYVDAGAATKLNV